MRLITLAALFSLLHLSLATTLKPRSYDSHDYYAVHLHPRTSPSDFAAHLGLELQSKLGDLDDHYILGLPRHENDIIKEAVKKHKRRKKVRSLTYRNDLLDGLLFHQKQTLKPPKVKRTPLPPAPLGHRQTFSLDGVPGQANETAVKIGQDVAKTLGIADPIFHDQWHLYNAVQVGHDLNVTGVWLGGTTGKNATVCIVDDGLDMDSKDLKANYFPEGSYDFNDQGDEPRPRLDDDKHGTRCAGEVAAVKNDVCGVGVAWDAKVAGIRILSKAITDADEATAMTYGFQHNHIYSCSWGPPDNGEEMGEPGVLIKRAMVTAVQKGRGGLGTIYVFAAGNGASADDNCNFDGYTNSIYSVTVGAIDRAGRHPYYSEKCSAQLAVTYSSGSGDAIHTTDVGENQCVTRHGGTSAAGPLAAGIYALVLEARPELTWRDIQWITVKSAVLLDNQDDEWQNTSIGKKFSHQYGYGKLDAWALVEAAKSHKLVRPQAWYFSPWQHVRTEIPQGDVGLSSTFKVTQELLHDANIEHLEHVTVTMNVNHTRRGDLSVELRSPHGVTSHLSTARKNDNYGGGYQDWTFMSVAHWGEKPEGDWLLIVKDTKNPQHKGTFIDWKLNLFGECRDASRQELLPLPTEHDDDEHDREDAAVGTHPVDVPTVTAEPPGNPTDHIDRPVNIKTSDTLEPTTRTAAFEAPVPTPTSLEDEIDHERPIGSSTLISPSASPTSKPDESFLPSPFPTFGVSKRTQIWIYGALALIIIFCIGLATFFFLARRKRLRHDREGYEFDTLAGDDDDDDDEGRGLAGGRRSKRRAGELYDAFAGEGESDEDLFSEDEKESYRDDDDEKAPLRDQNTSSSDEGSSGSSGIAKPM